MQISVNSVSVSILFVHGFILLYYKNNPNSSSEPERLSSKDNDKYLCSEKSRFQSFAYKYASVDRSCNENVLAAVDYVIIPIKESGC